MRFGTRFAAVLLLLAAAMLPAQPALALDLLLDHKIATAPTPDAAVTLVEAALAEPGLAPIEREALLQRLAELNRQYGRPAAAAAAYAELAAALETRLGPAAPEVASAWESAGAAYRDAGELDPGVRAYLGAINSDVARGVPAATHPLLATVDALIESEPSQRQRDRLAARKTALIRQYATVGPTGAPQSKSAPDAVEEGFTRVKIYYATNRLRTEATRPSEVYGAGRGELDYGTAEVSIPKIHKPGALEAPSVFTFEVSEDPNRHIILTSVTPSSRDAVFGEMRDDLKARESNEAFIFVHGFNVTFSDAARRTAQMAYDMNFDGLPILYSWPSQGNLLGYLADGAVVQLSGRKLLGFLEDVVKDTGATRIHLIAHSMGNRALTEALELFALRHAGKPPAFDEVLFTAPDLDAGLFADMVQTIRPVANRLTLYTSKNDWALKVSRQLNGEAPRAGEGAQGVVMPAAVDSIDMSVLGEDMLAHSYFADDTSALTDILSLFWRDAPPSRRCGMQPSPADSTSAEWSLEPSLCDGGAMLSALRLLRSEKIGNLSDALAVIDTQFPEADLERRGQIETALRRLFQQ